MIQFDETIDFWLVGGDFNHQGLGKFSPPAVQSMKVFFGLPYLQFFGVVYFLKKPLYIYIIIDIYIYIYLEPK